MVEKEDGVGPHETAVCSFGASLAGAERHDACSVGGDVGVVVGHPEPSSGVALPVRQLRQEDVAACVELRLQSLGVVTDTAACERRHAERRDDAGREAPHAPCREPTPHLSYLERDRSRARESPENG